jgi:hypothetical protein
LTEDKSRGVRSLLRDYVGGSKATKIAVNAKHRTWTRSTAHDSLPSFGQLANVGGQAHDERGKRMLRLPEDVEGRFCECLARPGKPRDIPGIPQVTTVMPGRTVIRQEVDDVEGKFRDEETMVHG